MLIRQPGFSCFVVEHFSCFPKIWADRLECSRKHTISHQHELVFFSTQEIRWNSISHITITTKKSYYLANIVVWKLYVALSCFICDYLFYYWNYFHRWTRCNEKSILSKTLSVMLFIIVNLWEKLLVTALCSFCA